MITPPPECETIVRRWPDVEDHEPPRLLPGLVRYYLDEVRDGYLHKERQRDEFFNALRGKQLREYVNAVRTSVHQTRIEEKKKRFQDDLKRFVIILQL